MARVPADAEPQRPRRLLAVSPVAVPGGAEMALVRLLRRLKPERWSVSLAGPGGPAADGLAAVAREAGWRWHELDSGPLRSGPRSAPRALGSWPRARALARQADVVYLNGAVCGRLLPAVRGAHTVLHIHDMVRRVPAMWRSADVVLVPTEAVARRLGGLTSQVVGCPIESDPPPVDAPWRPDGGPVIGFVGRLEPRKGPLDLVRAAPLIRAAAPAARIVVVGGDPYGSDPEYVARVHAEGAGVERYAWVDGAAGLMRHLDVLVLPSHEEPFGTVLAEAMAVGTPVVATRVDGLPEVVPDGVAGLLVRPGDPGALARAVLSVLDRRAELSAGARAAACRFDADRYAQHVQALIDPGLDTACTVEARE
jgi:glycosyltransferase involved in cell wall biosynthesis